MLRKIDSITWECAKEICRIKGEGRQFKGQRDCAKFVKENIEILPLVVNGYSTEKFRGAK